MSYSLPFKQGQKVIEIGGGARPMYRPNIDIRQCYDDNKSPTVDIIANIEDRLPIRNNEWDGVFAQYVLEHCNWRKLRDVLKEVNRILKPGGTAVFITPNTEAQMKHLLDTQDWDDAGSMLFGGQDYNDNAHKSFLSPTFATKLFKEAGFENIITVSWGEKKTDMIIEAKKGIANHEDMFDRHYFDCGTKVGGYKEVYRDFPVNWRYFNKIMERNPKSVLELGCARGYVLKRLQDAGIPSQGLEISNHCMLTRACNNINFMDICATTWPVTDVDMCVSINLLEHIPEDRLDFIIKEIHRVSKRGFHIITETSDGFDKTQVILRPKDWWKEKLGKDHEVFTNQEIGEFSVIDSPPGDDKLKWNPGCFTTMHHDGWLNTDIIDLSGFAQANGYKFMVHDARTKAPFEDNMVDLIVTNHMFEHLNVPEGINFLKECHRVMKPGAVMRLVVPCVEKVVNKYLARTLIDLAEVNPNVEVAKGEAGRLWSVLFDGHQTAYDFETLKAVAKEAGFKQVEHKQFREGHPQIMKETVDMLPVISLFVEITK